MKVSELKTEMDGKFDELGKRITSEGEATRRRFDELDKRITSEGEATRRHFDELDKRITSEGETTRRHFDEMDKRIRSEGETTRRHFDVVAEKMLSERNLALDRSMATAEQLAGLTAANAGDHVRFERRLDDHEQRLEAIEQDRNADQS